MCSACECAFEELKELAAFEIEEGDTLRLQPCVSPVWDTALVLNAMADSGYPVDSEAMQQAAILGLYDPDRSSKVLEGGKDSDWASSFS